tara:strand:- start:99 stop:641 length:543 start_codon:yes stop_codon:yes gene_type:complete
MSLSISINEQDEVCEHKKYLEKIDAVVPAVAQELMGMLSPESTMSQIKVPIQYQRVVKRQVSSSCTFYSPYAIPLQLMGRKHELSSLARLAKAGDRALQLQPKEIGDEKIQYIQKYKKKDIYNTELICPKSYGIDIIDIIKSELNINKINLLKYNEKNRKEDEKRSPKSGERSESEMSSV